MFFSNKKRESYEFITQLTNDIESLERLIHENILEDFDRIGAEQEFCLVDENFRPNPINEKEPLLRGSLFGALLDAVNLNIKKGYSAIKIFELGNTFRKQKNSQEITRKS